MMEQKVRADVFRDASLIAEAIKTCLDTTIDMVQGVIDVAASDAGQEALSVARHLFMLAGSLLAAIDHCSDCLCAMSKAQATTARSPDNAPDAATPGDDATSPQ